LVGEQAGRWGGEGREENTFSWFNWAASTAASSASCFFRRFGSTLRPPLWPAALLPFTGRPNLVVWTRNDRIVDCSKCAIVAGRFWREGAIDRFNQMHSAEWKRNQFARAAGYPRSSAF